MVPHVSYARTSDFSPILGAFIIICKTGAVADFKGETRWGAAPHLGTPIISATHYLSGLETAGLLLISPCLNRLALEACASLAKSNACSSVLGRLGANPARRQAYAPPALRLCSWVTSQWGQWLRSLTAEVTLVSAQSTNAVIEIDWT